MERPPQNIRQSTSRFWLPPGTKFVCEWTMASHHALPSSTFKVLEERNQWTKVHELVHISWAGAGTQSYFLWTSNKNTSYRFPDLIEERNQIYFCERERELDHFFRELPISWLIYISKFEITNINRSFVIHSVKGSSASICSLESIASYISKILLSFKLPTWPIVNKDIGSWRDEKFCSLIMKRTCNC